MAMNERRESLSKEEERDLWERFGQNRDLSARARLVDTYLDLARKVAARLFSHRTDDGLEFADYLQYARVGLLEALERYDPSREASFSTFAMYRMRGAILNGIEKYNERLAQWSFHRRLQKDRIDSLADHAADTTSTDLFERMTDVAIGFAMGHVLEKTGLDEAESEDDGPYASLELERLREQLRMVVDSLPERERQIVRYHYFEYMAFAEIASLLGLSKGRVSQLHARALALIRKGYECIGTLDLSL